MIVAMRILFFGQTKDSAGCTEVRWSETSPRDTEELWERLLREFPALSRQRSVIRLARNGVFTRGTEMLEANDEIALIPPVSGG